MARLRGPRLTPGERVALSLARSNADATIAAYAPDEEVNDPRPYGDALTEAFDQCVKLGLDPDPRPEYDAADLIRYAYSQGWLACESRLAAPNTADAIDLAITTPAAVVEQNVGESGHRWTIRAIQHAVAYGVTSEREASA